MLRNANVVDVLVSFASRGRPQEISERSRALAKIHIVDCLGVMLAGNAAPEISIVDRLSGAGALDLVALLAGKQVVEPSFAGLFYALCARILDYDDVQTTDDSIYGLLTNPSAPIVATILALAQRQEITGDEALNAFLMGTDIAGRLAESVDPQHLWGELPATANFGGVGSVVAAAKLLRLPRKAIRAALSIWATTSPQQRSTAESTLSSALRDAGSTRAAIQAVFLAADGMSMPETDEHPRFRLISPSSLERNLAKPHCIQQPGFAIRTYASNALSHPALDLTLSIVNLNDLKVEDIRRIDVEVNGIAGKLLLLRPPTALDELRRSLPFGVAVAASKGAVGIRDFSRVPRKALRDLMSHIHCVVNPEFDGKGCERATTRVRVYLKSGRAVEMSSDVAKGTPQKPLSEMELSHKFYQCALQSTDESNAERILNHLWALETSRNITAIFRSETGAAAPHLYANEDQHVHDLAD